MVSLPYGWVPLAQRDRGIDHQARGHLSEDVVCGAASVTGERRPQVRLHTGHQSHRALSLGTWGLDQHQNHPPDMRLALSVVPK